MNLGQLLLKSAAVVSSVTLLASFVAFRAGALNAFVAATTPSAKSQPLPQVGWNTDKFYGPESRVQAYATSLPIETAGHASRVTMAGSKSAAGILVPDDLIAQSEETEIAPVIIQIRDPTEQV